jgi:hypothetical protein
MPLKADAGSQRSLRHNVQPTRLWQALREKPALVRPAFDEVLRWESPIQTFFRTTTRTVDIGGIEIPQDAKVLLFLASANRDPRSGDGCDRRVPTLMGLWLRNHLSLGTAVSPPCLRSQSSAISARLRLFLRVQSAAFMLTCGCEGD